MVTHEERHTTRGRAHHFWEMLNGNVITDGWRDENVKESLDLCLSCKGCKGDCPVNVDIATYKAEFLSHYWEGRVRPRHAYAFGWIDQWARLASNLARVGESCYPNAGVQPCWPSWRQVCRSSGQFQSLLPRHFANGLKNGTTPKPG